MKLKKWNAENLGISFNSRRIKLHVANETTASPLVVLKTQLSAHGNTRRRKHPTFAIICPLHRRDADSWRLGTLQKNKL